MIHIACHVTLEYMTPCTKQPLLISKIRHCCKREVLFHLETTQTQLKRITSNHVKVIQRGRGANATLTSIYLRRIIPLQSGKSYNVDVLVENFVSVPIANCIRIRPPHSRPHSIYHPRPLFPPSSRIYILPLLTFLLRHDLRRQVRVLPNVPQHEARHRRNQEQDSSIVGCECYGLS